MTDSTKRKITKWFWALLIIPMVMLVVLLVLVWAFADIPSFEDLENPDSKLATQVLAENGEILTTFHIENRSTVSYEELSPYLVNAAVATEDVRFYKHSGIDFRSLGRVLVKTLLMHNSSQGGGSTITQQLAKTLYPRKDISSNIPGMSKVKMVWIKLKEWITAVKLERNYTKDEILTMYLNSVEFGSSSFGIKAAARTFYEKSTTDLTAEEAATLVGMVNKPTRYNPAVNPDKALVRRNFVLQQMYKCGRLFDDNGHKCTKAQLDSLKNISIDCSQTYQRQDHNAGVGPYFRDMLRRMMTAGKPKKSQYRDADDYTRDSLQWLNNPLYGWLVKNPKADGSLYDLDRDGLRIYTTINYKMQKYAEEAVAEHLGKSLQKSFWREQRYKTNKPFANDVDKETVDKLMKQARRWSDRYRTMKESGASEAEISKSFTVPTKMRVFSWTGKGYIDTLMTPDDSLRYYKAHLRAAFMAIEPVTGKVKAYVGGPNYRYFKYDNVSQGRRQVGSTVKPFLYTAAVLAGISPDRKYICQPVSFTLDDGTVWTPRSTDKDEWIGLTVNLWWGLSRSSNNISAALMKDVGPKPMVEVMRNMGITSHIDEVYSLCVGAAEVSVKEMVAAYNTFPSDGVYVEPLFVTRIEDNIGNTITEFTNNKRVAIGENANYTMISLMRGVVDGGTAGRLRRTYGLTGEIAGKTGTTNDNSDGWFIGYTPKLTAGVWVGGEDPQVHFDNTALGQGANAALPIWGIFMKKVIEDGTLGISSNDRFISPPNYSLTPDPEATAVESSTSKSEEDSFFD